MPHRLRELQPRHHAAIRMRIEGRSTEHTSRALAVRPRTLYIWFSDPLVKQALAEQLERSLEMPKARFPSGLSLVGAAGFEPATFRSQSGCATRLRYAPCGFESSPARRQT